MNLKTTSVLMLSYDYKKRFLAEYWQLKIRYDKLNDMYNNWDNLEFTPTCSKKIYEIQLGAMKKYLDVLTNRAVIEKIDLNQGEEKEIEFKSIVDICVRDSRDLEDCKEYVKFTFKNEYAKDLDYRSCFGRKVLNYIKEQWRKYDNQ